MLFRPFSLLEVTPDLVARLLSQVQILPTEPDSCWPWTGRCNHNGYGYFNYQRRQWLIHRSLYFILNQKDPGNLLVCHTCDVRPCCNPRHWFLGTHKDNQEDMARKGRAASGERHASKTKPERLVRGEQSHYAILKEHDVLQIREMYASENYSHRQLGDLFHVSASAIYMIVHGKTWKHLPSPPSLATPRRYKHGARGEQNAYAKLTELQVRQIKELLRDGTSTTNAATLFGSTRAAIYAIKKGYNWAHVEIQQPPMLPDTPSAHPASDSTAAQSGPSRHAAR
jgi:hypothetical protein